VAIVGGGPAGMSAAYYLIRLGYGVTVFEAMPVPGGMMAIGIPEYRLPRDVLRQEIDRIVGLGVDLRLDAVMGRDFSLNDLEAQGFSAVFLSTGAPKSRRLGVPGDALRGVIPATVFLKQVNLGEKPRLAGRVVVVGGGSTAMDAARSATRSGAESVTVLYRRGFKEMPAQSEEVEAAKREGIEIRIGTTVTEVVGADGSVRAVRTVEQAPTGQVERGRTIWEAVPGSGAELVADVVLVAIGEAPDPSILPEGAGIETSAWAGIAADPRTLATGRTGVFAGGDVVSGPKTIIDAVAAGRRAAGAIHEYLGGVADGEADILATVRYRTAPEASLRLDLEPRARARQPLPVVDRASFQATQVGFDEPTARSEASRCFRCDALHQCSTVTVTSGRGPADGPGRAHPSPPQHPVRPMTAVPGPSAAGGDR
jgi:NADH-quinone oxidoreductase subunit F